MLNIVHGGVANIMIVVAATDVVLMSSSHFCFAGAIAVVVVVAAIVKTLPNIIYLPDPDQTETNLTCF